VGSRTKGLVTRKSGDRESFELSPARASVPGANLSGAGRWSGMRMVVDNDLLGLAFAALTVIFTVWILTILVKYYRFRRLAPGSILSWESPRPWFFGLCLGIGFFMVAMTFLSGFVLHRPALHTVAQGLMALFYTVVFPLSFRIRKGFYATGIWAERGFLPYRTIRWLGWRQGQEIVLALRGEDRFLRQSYDFLRVPGDYYGQARRILADRIKDQSLDPQTSVLGLEADSSAQERV